MLVRLIVMLAALSAVPSYAQFPTKPLRLVVPFGPGGYSDIVARILGARLQETLGQPVVVENRAGSGGNIGAEVVAKAVPDGHTIMMAAPPVAINPSLYRSLTYDPRMLAPVAMIGDFPNVLVVGPASADRTVADVVARARRHPGRLNYASSGAGTSTHLTAELLKMATQTFIVHIPYRTAPAAQTAVMTGEADFYFSNLTPVAGHLRSGKLRALAVTAVQRAPLIPEVPTVAEAGYPQLQVSAFLGVMTTTGAPPTAIATLEAAFRKVLADPEVVTAIERQGGVVQHLDARAFGAFLATEADRWAQAVKYSGATVD